MTSMMSITMMTGTLLWCLHFGDGVECRCTRELGSFVRDRGTTPHWITASLF